MCNLSQKIKETGIETGIEIGKKEMIVKMHSKGYTIAQIADVAGMEEKRIEEIIKKRGIATSIMLCEGKVIQMDVHLNGFLSNSQIKGEQLFLEQKEIINA